jgi:hypothetical protein
MLCAGMHGENKNSEIHKNPLTAKQFFSILAKMGMRVKLRVQCGRTGWYRIRGADDRHAARISNICIAA